MSKEQAGPSVSHALKTGFRQIDSAWAYKNEDATGDAIRKSGIDRKDLWITSKLWNTFHGDRVELVSVSQLILLSVILTEDHTLRVSILH